MDTFYAPPAKIGRESVEIDGEEYNHLVHVMRKKAGDVIRVVDGVGGAFDVEVNELRKRRATGRIIARHVRLNEPELRVDVAVAMLKNPSRFDFLVEKGTEIGVASIIPLATERTIPKLAKRERWQKLALAAMKQSGRSNLPAVENLRPLASMVPSLRSYDAAIVCHSAEGPSEHLSQIVRSLSLRKDGSVVVLIGPEGGFSAEEIEVCTSGGCAVASLGPRRLRTETAAIVAAALLLQR